MHRTYIFIMFHEMPFLNELIEVVDFNEVFLSSSMIYDYETFWWKDNTSVHTASGCAVERKLKVIPTFYLLFSPHFVLVVFLHDPECNISHTIFLKRMTIIRRAM